ncbi:MAG: DUF1585 domain-containing protein [Planctomycetia bacterium]|nr:DUF1585 domain-containing protein [Planctomycetia bacterium]
MSHLLARGLEVYVSVPRLRQASGVANGRGVSDDEFVRLVAILSMGMPQAKIVITTRESSEIQRRVLPMVKVLSAGSSAVAPYTETGARFPLEASQFEVIDQRPFEAILGEYIAEGVRFENYDPVGAWRAKDGQAEIDASGALPGGAAFKSPAELKAILKARDGEFRRSIAEKLLVYALGRGLEYYDKCTVDTIVRNTAANHDRFSAFVLEIVNSDAFQKRRGKRGDEP